MVTTTTKPLGITATAVYAAFSGLICLPVGLLFLFASQASTSGVLFTACGLMFCVLGVFMLASVYGRFKNGARPHSLAIRYFNGIGFRFYFPHLAQAAI